MPPGNCHSGIRYLALRARNTWQGWAGVSVAGRASTYTARLVCSEMTPAKGIYSYRSYTTVISDADACELQNACGNPMQAVAVSPCALVHQTNVGRGMRELLTY